MTKRTKLVGLAVVLQIGVVGGFLWLRGSVPKGKIYDPYTDCKTVQLTPLIRQSSVTAS
jgi:hypothetical protein